MNPMVEQEKYCFLFVEIDDTALDRLIYFGKSPLPCQASSRVHNRGCVFPHHEKSIN